MPARGCHTSLRGHIINARLDHEPGNLFATFFDQTSPAGQLRLTISCGARNSGPRSLNISEHFHSGGVAIASAMIASAKPGDTSCDIS
jgi:hypothetical protein